ncbi:hypothetical protein HGRIS_003280 [Hohenbuehelia grisea]|uniref:MaoC-like domain-containing protein n=1 Tax=Hohenbuehelia grisea TaxID=104357 RepID=A0ABR3JPH1_9AGAR
MGGDFFKLVHLSNGFRMVGCAISSGWRRLSSEARIVSVTKHKRGQDCQGQGRVYCNGQPVITVVSAFLYVVNPSTENTFEIFISNQLKRLVKVGSVDFQQGDFACEGYTPHPRRFSVLQRTSHQRTLPSVSGDFNPIHINPYFSDYACASLRQSRAAVCGQRCNQALCQERCCSKATLGVQREPSAWSFR